MLELFVEIASEFVVMLSIIVQMREECELMEVKDDSAGKINKG